MLSASPNRIHLIDQAFAGFDRPSLLRQLGLPPWSPFVGDIPDLKPVSLTGARSVRVHKFNAPFIDTGAAFECCTGTKLCRCGATVVTIPCFETNLSNRASVCLHCEQLWAHVQADGWYVVDVTMDAVAKEYAAGETVVMRNWACYKREAGKYSDMIQLLKDAVAGGPCELPASWPGKSFDEIAVELLLHSDVLFEGSEKSRSGFRRTVSEQVAVAQYLSLAMPLYLNIRVSNIDKCGTFCERIDKCGII